jgi:hypothetical protein
MTFVAFLKTSRTLTCRISGRGLGLLGCRRLSSRAEKVSLPVIDISPFLITHGTSKCPVGPEDKRMADKVVEQVQAACSGSGFFIITGHGIPKTHFTRVFEEAAVRPLTFSCAC